MWDSFLDKMLKSRSSVPGPSEVFIEPTRACNLRCIHCAVCEPDYVTDTLRWEVFERVLPFLRRHRPLVHLFGHGESLVHKRFTEMFEAVLATGAQVGFQTNGTLLSPELTSRLLDAAGPQRMPYVAFSIEAAEKDLFERIRRKASFDAFVRNARFLSEEKKRRGWLQPHIYFDFVAMRMNVPQLPAVVRLVHELGGSSLLIADLRELSSTKDQALWHDPGYARPFWEEATGVAAALGVELKPVPALAGLFAQPPPPEPTRVDDVAGSEKVLSEAVPASDGGAPAEAEKESESVVAPIPPRLAKDCLDPWTVTFVRASGEVWPCCIGPAVLGDVQKEALESIWKSEVYEQFRQLVAGPSPPGMCRTCILRGWKPAPEPGSAPVLLAATRRLAGTLSLRSGPPIRVGIKVNGTSFEVGDPLTLEISVETDRVRPPGEVDLYVMATLPSGDTKFVGDDASDRSAYLAGWKPSRLRRFPAYRTKVTEKLVGETEVSLVVVPAGIPVDEKEKWLASDSICVRVRDRHRPVSPADTAGDVQGPSR